MAKAAATKPKAEATKPKQTEKKPPRAWIKPFRAIGSYFVGAWVELRQVRWPNRRATWSLTLAVIIFSLFFTAVILGLDYVFQYLFKEILL